MSSPTHPTPSDVDEECAFPSANILDYTSTLPNYFPARPGNNSSDFLENSKNDEIPPIFSPFYNNPYLKDMDFDEVKTKLKEARTQIVELQKKHMGQRDKIAFIHFRISDLEMTLEDIQDRHQLYMKNLMGHTS
ncbi:hypothetical protein Tco_0968684 [Tanacetum coccineum]